MDKMTISDFYKNLKNLITNFLNLKFMSENQRKKRNKLLLRNNDIEKKYYLIIGKLV